MNINTCKSKSTHTHIGKFQINNNLQGDNEEESGCVRAEGRGINTGPKGV